MKVKHKIKYDIIGPIHDREYYNHVLDIIKNANKYKSKYTKANKS